MMTIEEKLVVLNEAFETLRHSGAVRTKGDFAKMLGITQGSLSTAFSGNESYLTDSLINKVKLAVQSTSKQSSSAPQPQSSTKVALLPIDAIAGHLGEFAEAVHQWQCEYISSPVKGASFAIRISGDSMSPEYPNGSTVLIKEVDADVFVEWGKVYVLSTKNGAIIKEVHKTEDENVIECHSLNPDPKYQPYRINKKNILGWYRVLLVMSMK